MAGIADALALGHIGSVSTYCVCVPLSAPSLPLNADALLMLCYQPQPAMPRRRCQPAGQ